MTKYSPKAQAKISNVMHEFGEHKLRSRSGKVVKNQKQAVAIAISEARDAVYKVPPEPKTKKSAKKN